MTDAEAAALGRFFLARLRWHHTCWLRRSRAARDAATPEERIQARIDAHYLRRAVDVLLAVRRDARAAWRNQEAPA